ncbi:MAG TPA: DUF1249 domain-containing protein [Gammaproteobacteria bacterium]|nr:DUF1249 domain-containing protein [Gammaproteobacteria bacterium]
MEQALRQYVHHGIPPVSFAGLMELYECNYIRLRNLVPDSDAIPDAVVSHIEGVLDLHLHITERCKFTTTLNLTYYFEDPVGSFPAPDILVRIYHDAQVGEVISCGRRRGARHARYNRMSCNYTLAEKWHMNRFLQKWLGYCLMQGHRFTPERIQLAAENIRPVVEDSLLIVES